MDNRKVIQFSDNSRLSQRPLTLQSAKKTTNAASVYHDRGGTRWFSNLTKNIQCKIVGSLLTFNSKNKANVIPTSHLVKMQTYSLPKEKT